MRIQKILNLFHKSNTIKSGIFIPEEIRETVLSNMETLKSITISHGDVYELRGVQNFVQPGCTHVFDNYYQLIKKCTKFGKEKEILVAEKAERYIMIPRPDGPDTPDQCNLARALYDETTGKITEISHVGNGQIFVNGDVLKMYSPVYDLNDGIKLASMPNLQLNLFGKDLTPMAKRVLTIIGNARGRKMGTILSKDEQEFIRNARKNNIDLNTLV